MIRIRPKLLCIILCIAISGCSNKILKKTLQDFMQIEISFPEGLQKIHERQISNADIDSSKPILVVYHDRLSCSLCEVSHIYIWQGLYEHSEIAGFNIVNIFSPPESEYKALIEHLKRLNFPYPIYIDRYDCFSQINEIPKDRRFHCFLIDTEKHPVFVGNPLENEELKNLFNKKILSM